MISRLKERINHYKIKLSSGNHLLVESVLVLFSLILLLCVHNLAK